MKNLTILLIVIACTIQCSAQSKIVNLTDRVGIREADAYYKDVDNNLDPFVGTWEYSDGSTVLRIVLKKEIKYYTGKYYEDLIIGEYKYIENGVEKINTISELNTIYTDQEDHLISGNRILENQQRPLCTDCLPNEKRLDLFFGDHINDVGGDAMLRRTTIDGQEALKAFIKSDPLPRPAGSTHKEMFVPDGEYVLIKQ